MSQQHNAAILHASAMRILMSPKGKGVLVAHPHDLYEEAIVLSLGDEAIVFAMTRWSDEDDDEGPERTVVRRVRPNQVEKFLKRLPSTDVPLNPDWMAVDTDDWSLDDQLEAKIRRQMDLLDRMSRSQPTSHRIRYAASIGG